MTDFPKIQIANSLAESITVYDAFDDHPDDKSITNHFGTLTRIGTVDANASADFAPIHGPISAYVIYDSHNDPVKWIVTRGKEPQKFEVVPADLDVVTATRSFVALLHDTPDSVEAQQFTALTRDGRTDAEAVNTFFRGTSDYPTCTFVSYLLVVVAMARTAASRALAPEQQRYSLSILLDHLGIAWPADMPDIELSAFSCGVADSRVLIGGQLNVQDVVFGDGVLDRVLSVLPSQDLRFTVSVDLEPGMAIGSIQLRCLFDTLSIELSKDLTISFTKPTVSLSITPLFKFVVIEIKADIPFELFGGPPFVAAAAMTIDNVEAEVGVTIEGGKNALPAPPGIKGLHVDSVGVGMGLFFEPPGFALGVQGAFHLGDGPQTVQLDDDMFALVCTLDSDVPNPLFLSCYVPTLSLKQVIELFTDHSTDLDVPVMFRNLSLCWAENPTGPVTLPDGSLAPIGYSFSADMDLLGLTFYADVNLDLTNGVQGTAQLGPVSLDPVLSITGNGPGVSIKVDADGNPIRNNTVPRSAAAQQAIANASTRQLVPPGGPQLTISTSKAPYFKLAGHVDFLGLHEHVDITVDKKGIRFALGFTGIVSGQMNCVLQDYHNFTGDFSYGPDYELSLPSIGGLSLGKVRLTAQIDVALALRTISMGFSFSAIGGFTFAGQLRRIGSVDLNAHTAGLSDVLSAIERWLADNIKAVFGELVDDAERWAQAVYAKDIEPAVQGARYVTDVLKKSFGKTLDEMSDLLKGSSFPLQDVAGALKSTFGAPADTVARVLSSAYKAGPDAVGRALHMAGYGYDLTAKALSSVFHVSADAVASTLRGIGYDAEDTARAVSDAFNLAPDAVQSVLKDAGFSPSDVKHAFESIGGDFEKYAKKVWDELDPTHWFD